MKALRFLSTIGVATVLSVAPSAAMSLDEVVARHVEARGGRDGWAKVRTMKLAGQFQAFSKVAPFTLQRKRDHRYHLDSSMNGNRLVIGYDGETAWWDNQMRQPGAAPISEGPDLEAVMRDVDFATVLFDYADRGFTAELIGETEIEGIPALGVKIVRGEDSVDTWYLDPQTYLEVARESPGSDFGRPVPTRTFFDDFREVEGLMIPHYVEGQWYTRDRVLRVESIELNPDVDDALFGMPAPPGMGPFVGLAGEWKVKTSIRQQPGAPWQETEREGEIEALMRGALMRERFTSAGGTEILWTLSYDNYHETYRFTSIDSQRNQLDVREGALDDEGKLVLTNLETGTTWSGFGMTFHTRLTLFDVSSDGFKAHTEISNDGGESWFLAAKQEYVRGD